MADEIVNRVAQSGLITLDLADFLPNVPLAEVDIKDQLWQGMALKEQDFRDYIKSTDWSVYQGKAVAIRCSADAIIPLWAWMLLTASIEPYASVVHMGTISDLKNYLMGEEINAIKAEDYTDARVIIKGCGDAKEQAYVTITNKLRPVVKSLMFGEACSTVPVYKK